MNKIKKVLSLALCALGIASFAFGARAEKVDYILYLKDGAAYKAEACEEKDKVTLSGLSFADGAWTMNNFTFETTAAEGIVCLDMTTVIKVEGVNAVEVAESGDRATRCLHADGEEGCSLTILGTDPGSSSLTLTAGDYTGNPKKQSSEGINAINLIIKDATVKATGGAVGAHNDAYSCGIYVDKSLVVIDAIVTAEGKQAGGGSAGVEFYGPVIILGNGKVTASSSSSDNPYGVTSWGDAAEPAAVAKDDSGNVLTYDVEEGAYFVNGSTTEYATKVTLTKSDVAKYSIYLSGGKAYMDDAYTADITSFVAAKGLTYADGVWTMNNFRFETLAQVGVAVEDRVTIKLLGENVITVGDTNAVEMVFNYGMNLVGKPEDEEDKPEVIVTGGGSLVVTALLPPSGGHANSRAVGIFGYASITITGGAQVTAVAKGGNPSGNYSKCVGIFSLFGDLVINGATVNATAANGSAVIVGQSTSVSEDSSLTAKGGIYGFLSMNETAPTCTVAKDGITGAELDYKMVAEPGEGEEDPQYTYKNGSDVCLNVVLGNPVPPEPIESAPTPVENATFLVYTNGFLSADGIVWSNGTATVVYTAKPGYMFEDCSVVVTNVLNTTVNPAVNADGALVPTAKENTYFVTFSATDPFGIKMSQEYGAPALNLEWSTNKLDWETFDAKGAGRAAGCDGETYRLYLRGSNNRAFCGDDYPFASSIFSNTVGSASAIACSGNIETLLDYKTVAKGEHPEMGAYAFSKLFMGMASLTTPPELPATNLTDHCYYEMFENCSSLKESPALPAMTLKKSCYSCMFRYCYSLTSVPTLPATTMADYCYYYMFFECTSLNTVPELPAMNLANSCYREMFENCTSLTVLPKLPATKLVNSCYHSMFNGCSSLKVNKEGPGEEWKIPATDATGIYFWGSFMFDGTAGTLTGTPELNTTYYVVPPSEPIESAPTPVENATFLVYTNGFLSADGIAWSNETATVVYTAKPGYLFADGSTVATNVLDTTVNPAVNADGALVPVAIAEPDYLTFSAKEPFGIQLNKGTYGAPELTLEYSTDRKNWQTFSVDTDYAAVMNGGTYMLCIRGTGNLAFASGTRADEKCNIFAKTADSVATAISCSGDVMTLLDWLKVAKGEEPPMSDFAFAYLFRRFSALTAAPALTATNLTQYCYFGMFNECTSLVEAPALPAMKVAYVSYGSMFMSCTSLAAAPELPATELSDSCYSSMFYGCSSLTEAPVLPATTLTDSCYYNMFRECTSLTDLPKLPATTLAPYCYERMFYGCTSLVVNKTVPGKEWSIPAEAASSAGTAYGWNSDMFTNAGGGDVDAPQPGVTYYILSAYTPVSISSKPAEVANATAAVYTNGFLSADGIAWSNETATVVYTVNAGYIFADGSTVATNVLDTTVNPAVNADGAVVPVAKKDTYFITFSAKEPFGMQLVKTGAQTDVNLAYSTDGIVWTAVTAGTGYDAAAKGDVYAIHFRGSGNQSLSRSNSAWSSFTNTADSVATAIACSGNVETLLDYETVAKGAHPTMARCAFQGLFMGFEALTDAPELPATAVPARGYRYMFRSCTSLTNAPALPAKQLADSCYEYMFRSCTSLTKAPELPAMNLSLMCYNGMFFGCTSLTDAPALPATALAESCYQYMFRSCTSLTTTPELPATTLMAGCYYRMFSSCTSLTAIPTLDRVTSLAKTCCALMFEDCTGLMVNQKSESTGEGMDWWIQKDVVIPGDAGYESDDGYWAMKMFNGTIGKISGNAEIVPGVVYLVSESSVSLEVKVTDASKPYDGTPLTSADYEITGKGQLKDGDKLVLTTGGSIVDVGEVENAVVDWDVLRDGKSVRGEYDIVSTPGLLTVTKAETPIVIAAKPERLADGSANGFTCNEDALIGDDTVVATVDVTTNAAGIVVCSISSYAVMRGTVDITANYTVVTETSSVASDPNAEYIALKTTKDIPKVAKGEEVTIGSVEKPAVVDILVKNASFSIGANATYALIGEMRNAKTVKVAAGTKTRVNGKQEQQTTTADLGSLRGTSSLTSSSYTDVTLEYLAGTAAANSVTVGKTSVFTAGDIDLGAGSDKLSVGIDVTFESGDLYDIETLSFGSRSTNEIGNVVGAQKLTVAAGKSPTSKVAAVPTLLVAGDITMLADKANTVTIGNWTEFAAGNVVLGAKNDKLSIGDNSKAVFSSVDFGGGKDTLTIGKNSTVILVADEEGCASLTKFTIGKGTVAYLSSELIAKGKKVTGAKTFGNGATIVDLGPADVAKQFKTLEEERADNVKSAARPFSGTVSGWLNDVKDADGVALDSDDFLVADRKLTVNITVSKGNTSKIALYVNGIRQMSKFGRDFTVDAGDVIKLHKSSGEGAASYVIKAE